MQTFVHLTIQLLIQTSGQLVYLYKNNTNYHALYGFLILKFLIANEMHPNCSSVKQPQNGKGPQSAPTKVNGNCRFAQNYD